MDIGKEIVKEEKKLEKSIKNLNTWMIVSSVLAVLLVAAVGVMLVPHGMSSQKAGEYLVDTLNSKFGGGITLTNVSNLGNLYEVTVLYQGNEVPVYMTKDGKYMVAGVQELNPSSASSNDDAAAETPQEVPKSDKPKVEAFVFTYCPYGLQFEKALAPVYDLLKTKADINIVQIGAMHGEYEKIEAFRQLCIQKNYNKDKLWIYLKAFSIDSAIGACGSDTTCSKPLVEALMKKQGIDVTKINTCITNDAQALYDADGAIASSLGIGGSPTFVINGVETSVERTAESIKKAICNSFTTAPSECSQTLSTTAASPGFGSSASSGSSSSCGA